MVAARKIKLCREGEAEGGPWPGGLARTGFTLIELMVVIAIMGIVLSIGIPSIYRVFHKELLAKTWDDVHNVCLNAREQAIMSGRMAEIIFHAKDGRLDILGGGPSRPGDENTGGEQFNQPSQASGRSAQLPEEVGIAMLKVNGISYMEAEEARVRFYPNGTSDELRLILLRPSDRRALGLFVEVTTGLPDMESDPNKLANEIR
ncbi:MAG TPA: type II secretion system protein [Methylomirabilota bacterium]|jgi:prepilin-type N-terminal cleavage/methylation domain-containing protein|nr:type II secretion system protein [Methylomirabilota bacterium]